MATPAATEVSALAGAPCSVSRTVATFGSFGFCSTISTDSGMREPAEDSLTFASTASAVDMFFATSVWLHCAGATKANCWPCGTSDDFATSRSVAPFNKRARSSCLREVAGAASRFKNWRLRRLPSSRAAKEAPCIMADMKPCAKPEAIGPPKDAVGSPRTICWESTRVRCVLLTPQLLATCWIASMSTPSGISANPCGATWRTKSSGSCSGSCGKISNRNPAGYANPLWRARTVCVFETDFTVASNAAKRESSNSWRPITAAINPCVISEGLRKPMNTKCFTKASTFFNWLHWAEHNELHTSAVKKYGKLLQSCMDARFCASSVIGPRALSLWAKNRSSFFSNTFFKILAPEI